MFGKELRKSGDGNGEENLGSYYSGMCRKQNMGKREGREDVKEP